MKAHYFGPKNNGVVSVIADRYRLDGGYMIPRLDTIFNEDDPVYSCVVEFDDGGVFTISASTFHIFYSKTSSTATRAAEIKEALVFRGYREWEYAQRRLWGVATTDRRMVQRAIERYTIQYTTINNLTNVQGTFPSSP